MINLDATRAKILVLNTLGQWLKDNGAIRDPRDIDLNRTLKDNPPKGYGMSFQRYLKFCDDISDILSSATGRRLNLSPAWRRQHYSDTLGEFAAAVTNELLDAAPTAIAKTMQPLARTLQL